MTRLAAIVSAFVLAAGAAAAEVNPSTVHEVSVGGTGSALATIRLLGEQFRTRNLDCRFEFIQGLGGRGSSRAVARRALDIGVTAIPPGNDDVARAGLRLIPYAVSPFIFFTSNMNVASLTLAEIEAIYAGRMTQWPDGTRIRIIMRQEDDDDSLRVLEYYPSLRAGFRFALQRSDLPVRMTDIEMAETAEQVEGSFGYGSLAQLLIERRRLKAIALDGVEPTPENAASGRYKAVKRHYLVVAADVKGCPARFVDFARSAEAWSFLRGFGWRPIENAGRP